MNADIEQLAKALTPAQREALGDFSADWIAGPTLPDAAISRIKRLEAAGLLERQFGDEGPPVHSVSLDCLTVKLSACWHFRLTPLGLALRTHLTSNKEPGQ